MSTRLNFIKGQSVEYHSESAGSWIACKIKRVNKDGGIEIDVKANTVFSPSQAERLLRIPTVYVKTKGTNVMDGLFGAAVESTRQRGSVTESLTNSGAAPDDDEAIDEVAVSKAHGGEEFTCAASVEILQLLCNFEDALGQGAHFKTYSLKRPLMRSFHRCVVKVVAHNRVWVAQLVLHKTIEGLFPNAP